MPDWREFVNEQLAGLQLVDCEREDVIAELADHLGQTYEVLRQTGASERDAIHGALLQVENWNELQRQIYVARTKESAVNPRTSRLWLPSFVALAISMVSQIGFGLLGLGPGPLGLRPDHEGSLRTGGAHLLNEYTVWLMVLPLIGALGARLSKRAGGTFEQMVLSGIFPAMAWVAILAIVLPFAMMLAPGMDRIIEPIGQIGFLVLIPGACLLLGVLVYVATARWRVRSAA